MNILHTNIYTTNTMNDFNNLSRNEEDLNVSKVYPKKYIFPK